MSFYTISNANPNLNISNNCKSKSEVNRFILLDQTQICEIKVSMWNSLLKKLKAVALAPTKNPLYNHLALEGGTPGPAF